MIDAETALPIDPLILLHTVMALLAIALGLVVLVSRKGTSRHRFMGRIWAGLMVFVSLTSFGIGETFSIIHALSIWVIFGMAMAFIGIRHIKGRRGLRIHSAFMIGNYIGLWGAAVPAFLTEGRLMHALVFG